GPDARRWASVSRRDDLPVCAVGVVGPRQPAGGGRRAEARGPADSGIPTPSLRQLGTTVAAATRAVRADAGESPCGRLGLDHGPHGATGALEGPGDRRRPAVVLESRSGPAEARGPDAPEPDAHAAVRSEE